VLHHLYFPVVREDQAAKRQVENEFAPLSGEAAVFMPAPPCVARTEKRPRRKSKMIMRCSYWLRL